MPLVGSWRKFGKEWKGTLEKYLYYDRAEISCDLFVVRTRCYYIGGGFRKFCYFTYTNERNFRNALFDLINVARFVIIPLIKY